MTGAGHKGSDPARLPADVPADVEEQRRRARRAAFALGALALCMYLGFIIATGLRG